MQPRLVRMRRRVHEPPIKARCPQLSQQGSARSRLRLRKSQRFGPPGGRNREKRNENSLFIKLPQHQLVQSNPAIFCLPDELAGTERVALGEDPRQRGNFKRGEINPFATIRILAAYRCHI